MLLLFLAGLGVYKTISYVPVWKNDSSLFTYNLKVNPNNARMRFNYGAVLIQQAMAKQEQAFLQNQPMDTGSINALARQGINELQKGTAIFPGDATAKIHEGNGWLVLRNIEAAESNLRQALVISPNNRFALTSLGGLLLNTRRYQEAAQTWEKINPELRTAGDYYNLSLAYQALGDQQKAGYYKQLSGR
jgi:tetratricopeptide (TPR) repeat protein